MLNYLNRFLLVACVLAAIPVASAQTFQAQITGVVCDASGAVIPNARVAATNVATGVASSTECNDQGIYRLLALPPGQCSLSTSLRGFKTSEQDPITLQVNDSLHRNRRFRSLAGFTVICIRTIV
jgi:hypothetical protein